MMQVPEVLDVKTAFEVLSESEQLVALPPETEYVTEPEPEPPLVLKVGVME